MNRAIDDLRDFLLSSTGKDEKKDLLSQIRRFGLGNILFDDVEKLDLMEYFDCCDRLMLQQVRDNSFEKEIYSLIDVSKKKGIRFIFLKGIFLARDIYPPNQFRESYDIDVIVDFEDINEAFNILEESGYRIAYFADESFVNKKNHSIQKDSPILCQKHIEFVKDTYFLECPLPVMVELHVNFAPPSYLQIDTKPILDRVVQINSENHDVWILELHDRFIFLLIHYIENFSENIARILMGRNVSIPKLQLLHDMALFIDKYKDVMSWDTIIDRTEEWNIQNRLALVFRMIEKIYPGRIPMDVIKKLDRNRIKEQSFQESLYQSLLEIDINDIIFKDLKQNLAAVLSLDMVRGPVFQCRSAQKENAGKSYEQFSIDEYNRGETENSRTYLSAGKRPESSLECSAKGTIYWEKDAFCMNIKVFDDIFIFADGNKDFSMVAQDGIELLFLTDEVSICQLGIIPTKTDNGVVVNIVSCKEKIFLGENMYRYKLDIQNDGYEIFIAIPWKYLNIEPHIGLEFGFDIAINNCEDAFSQRKTRLSLTTGGSDWYDITAFAKMILCE